MEQVKDVKKLKKEANIKARITEEEKEKIKAYCEDHNIKNISEFIRIAVYKLLKGV